MSNVKDLSAEESALADQKFHALGVKIVPAGVERGLARPRFLPGDIVRTKGGKFGVIVESQLIVDGQAVDWCGFEKSLANKAQFPEAPKYVHIPSYSIRPIKDMPAESKYAWYHASEWDLVALGPLHNLEDSES